MNFKRTAILGAGSWGTALAVLWARSGKPITLWGHDGERVARLRSARVNVDYLPGVELPRTIEVTNDLADCAEADLVVFVTPSTAVRSVASSLKPFVRPEAVLLSCTKGIEHGSGLRVSEILDHILPSTRLRCFPVRTSPLKFRESYLPLQCSVARTDEIRRAIAAAPRQPALPHLLQ